MFMFTQGRFKAEIGNRETYNIKYAKTICEVAIWKLLWPFMSNDIMERREVSVGQLILLVLLVVGVSSAEDHLLCTEYPFR